MLPLMLAAALSTTPAESGYIVPVVTLDEMSVDKAKRLAGRVVGLIVTSEGK